MNVSTMQGRVLDWVTSAALPQAKADPSTWKPTEKWENVEAFWQMKGAGCHRTVAHKQAAANCIGEGAFEASLENYLARGADPLEAICRVLVYSAFGPSVDVPKEFR